MIHIWMSEVDHCVYEHHARMYSETLEMNTTILFLHGAATIKKVGQNRGCQIACGICYYDHVSSYWHTQYTV